MVNATRKAENPNTYEFRVTTLTLKKYFQYGLIEGTFDLEIFL